MLDLKEEQSQAYLKKVTAMAQRTCCEVHKLEHYSLLTVFYLVKN